MTRLVFPTIGLLAALWATYSIVQTRPTRAQTRFIDGAPGVDGASR